MAAYILVIISLSGAVSQQEYDNMASCENAGAIVARMDNEGSHKPKIKWACIPKGN